MAKYLVTDGAGFIGSNNVAQVANLCYVDLIEFIEGDLRDLDSVRKAVDDVDIEEF